MRSTRKTKKEIENPTKPVGIDEEDKAVVTMKTEEQQKSLKSLLPKVKPLPDNVIFEVSFIGRLENAIGKESVRFQGIKDLSAIQWSLDLSKLYLTLFNKHTPEDKKPLIIQKINEFLKRYPNIQDRYYYFVGELRKIELYDPDTDMVLLSILRAGVYLPKDYTTHGVV